MKVLVTGGAGYIGSHVCKLLACQGHMPITVDNMVYGHEWAVKWGPLHQLDILDTDKLTALLKTEKPDAVIHFAAFAYVGESVLDPLKYYKNNVFGSLSLLQAMRESGVSKIVFSSTCATYGIPESTPIHEEVPQKPINPYGQSKLMVEKILSDFARAYGIKSVALRYFNASGADSKAEIGEDHNPETHLIPLAIQAAFDPSKPLTIMGTDYNTPDGTCVRDYIHVQDLASAHVRAIDYLTHSEENFSYFNLGTGIGVSVKEIIEAIERNTGRTVAAIVGARREGDPPALVADGRKAIAQLDWKSEHSSVDNIIATAVRWYEKKQKFGASA
jgi:UDP-arabinose 4-epimerase